LRKQRSKYLTMAATWFLVTNSLLQHSIKSTKIIIIQVNNDNRREVRRAYQQHYFRPIF
jgi:hypothetical protein